MKIHQETLIAALGRRADALQVQVFDVIGSTSQWLMAHPPTAATLVVAAQQTAGKGRRGRVWQSPAGGLYLSIGVPLSESSAVGPALSPAIAIVIAEALDGLGVAGVGVKWPNDIVANGAKLAGILLERTPNSVICGIGVNWRVEAIADLPDDRSAAGLTTLMPDNDSPSREQVAAMLASTVLDAMARSEAENQAYLTNHWRQWDVLAGKSIVVDLAVQAAVSGVAAGITPDGALRLKTAQGEQPIHSGEARVRGGWERSA